MFVMNNLNKEKELKKSFSEVLIKEDEETLKKGLLKLTKIEKYLDYLEKLD